MRGIIRILQSLGGGGNQVNFILTQTKSFDLTPSQVINNKRSQTKKRKNIRRIEELRCREASLKVETDAFVAAADVEE